VAGALDSLPVPLSHHSRAQERHSHLLKRARGWGAPGDTYHKKLEQGNVIAPLWPLGLPFA
jgi:hypothetical protein